MPAIKQSEMYDSPTLLNLHSNEYNQEFDYYPFVTKLGRCVGKFNTLNDLSSKVI